MTIQTEVVEQRRSEYDSFIGRSKVMTVLGEHELEETADGGTKLRTGSSSTANCPASSGQAEPRR